MGLLLGLDDEGPVELGTLVGTVLVGTDVEGVNVGLELEGAALEGEKLEGTELGFSVGDAVGKVDDG